jgi:hypothetical protein
MPLDVAMERRGQEVARLLRLWGFYFCLPAESKLPEKKALAHGCHGMIVCRIALYVKCAASIAPVLLTLPILRARAPCHA